MKFSGFSRAERLIRRVVEQPFSWLSESQLDPFQLAKHLTTTYIEPAGGDLKPNHFVVFLNQVDYRSLDVDLPKIEHQTADYVSILAQRLGSLPEEPISVAIKVDDKLSSRSARIEASVERQQLSGGTEILIQPDFNDSVLEDIHAVDAFLIVQGRRHFPLDLPIVRIGRRMDNDLVLDSAAVSRQHAQIRWRNRNFVLYDVSSQGKTYVNGLQTDEYILRPGDVIALSDVLLVYGEGHDIRITEDIRPDDDELASTMLRPKE